MFIAYYEFCNIPNYLVVFPFVVNVVVVVVEDDICTYFLLYTYLANIHSV